MLALAWAVVPVASAGPAPAAAPAAEVVFVNGRVFTADAELRVVEAFAVGGGRFLATGTSADVRRLAVPGTRIVDLQRRFVAPGLTDGHFHSEGGGPGVDLSRANSIAAIQVAIGAAVRRAGPGMVILTNNDWHEMQLAERRLPTAKELDAVAPRNPVVVRRGGHSFILNTVALEKWGITRDLPDPPGGRIGRDASGDLNGELINTARAPVKLPPEPPVGVEDLVTTQRVLNAYGITAVRVPGNYKTDAATTFRLARQLREAGGLTLRYNILLRYPGDPVPALDASGLRQDDGDEWVRIGGVKLGVDGGFEGGYMQAPYAEPYGRGGEYRGVVTMPPEPLARVLRDLNARGWRVATHTSGDGAVGMVLDAYETANRGKSIVGRRWALEHAFLSTPEHRARARALGVGMSVQNHLFVAAPAFRRYLGPDRAAGITPLRTYLGEGLDVALGTDSPVIPVNPFWMLYHFVTRDTRTDGIYGPEEAVTDRAMLLRAGTHGFAVLNQEEATKGTIEAGKLADFVVLSDDFLTMPAERIRDLRALSTWVDGREVYRDPALRW